MMLRALVLIVIMVPTMGHAQLHVPVSCGSSASHGTIDWSTTPTGSSEFNWTPDGSLSNSFTNISGTGVDATITFSGETGTFGVWGTQTPSIGSNPTGGVEECLQMYTNGFTNGIALTLDFSTPIGEIAFDLAHVNALPGANGDIFIITGLNELGQVVYPTITPSANPSYTYDAFGNIDANASSTNGDDDEVGIHLSDPNRLVSFTIFWGNCTTCTPVVHGLGIKDIEFCISNVDGDLLGDHIDIDDDNDGIPDLIETGGLDPLADVDGDGVLAYLDDNDNDPSVFNDDGSVEMPFDFDGDNIPNHFDLDSDNDGIADIIEAGGEDPTGDGQVEYQTIGSPETMLDTDSDGLSDEYDSNVPAFSIIEVEIDLDEYENETTWTLTGPLGNTVGSGGPYAGADNIITSSIYASQPGAYVFTISDSYGDGISLNGGSDENASSGYTIDVDGTNVYNSPPSHNFGFFNTVSFVVSPNAGVAGTDIPLHNTDLVGNPDYLDLDSDNDGIGDNIELNLGDVSADLDGGNKLDGMVGNGSIIDMNGNGWSDPDEGPDARVDSDGDGLFDMLENDSDNDGIRDFLEGVCTFCPAFGNEATIDSDGDGFSDQYENLTATNANGGNNQGLTPNDHEADGTPDYLDLDTDNDGGFDWTEGYDVNGDGIAAPEFQATAVSYAQAGGSPSNYPITNSDTDVVPDFADNQPLTQGYVESTRPPFFTASSMAWVDEDSDGIVDLLDGNILGNTYGQYAPLPNTDGILDRDWRDVNTVVILPIELLTFTAVPVGEEVVLDWETATEKDVDYFVLERSKDVTSWEEIAVVDAIGNSTSLSTYQWIDRYPLVGVSYYRLKVIDMNYSTAYSHIEVINRSDVHHALVYPNPAESIVTLQADFEEGSLVSIVSTTGAVVASKVVSSSKNTLSFNIEALSSGCYYFEFTTDSGKRFTEKLIVY